MLRATEHVPDKEVRVLRHCTNRGAAWRSCTLSRPVGLTWCTCIQLQQTGVPVQGVIPPNADLEYELQLVRVSVPP